LFFVQQSFDWSTSMKLKLHRRSWISVNIVLHGLYFLFSDLRYPLNVHCMWWWVDQLNSRKILSQLLRRYILASSSFYRLLVIKVCVLILLISVHLVLTFERHILPSPKQKVAIQDFHDMDKLFLERFL